MLIVSKYEDIKQFFMDRSHLATRVVSVVVIVSIIGFIVYKISQPNSIAISAYFPEGKSEYMNIVPDVVYNGRQVLVSIPEEFRSNPSVNPMDLTVEPNVPFTALRDNDKIVVSIKPKIMDNSEIAFVYKKNDVTFVDYATIYDVPKVFNVYPRSGDTVENPKNIAIIFDKQADILDTVSKSMNLEHPPVLTPDHPGVWQWKNGNTLMFVPQIPFTPSTTYTVFLAPLRDSQNNPYDIDDNFQTYSFRISPLARVSESLPVSVSDPATFEFSSLISAEKTRKYITIKKNGEKITPLVVIDKNTISIKPPLHPSGYKMWDFNSTYSISIEKVHTPEGNIAITQPYENTFSFGDVVNSVNFSNYWKNGNTGKKYIDIDPTKKINVSFTEEIEKTSFITSPMTIKTEYGLEQVCNEKGCYERLNKKNLLITLDKNQLPFESEVPFTIKKAVSTRGINLFSKPFTVALKTPAKLKLYPPPAQPEGDNTNAFNTDYIVLCSNNPLKRPENISKNFAQYLNFLGGPASVTGWYYSEDYKNFAYVYNPENKAWECPTDTYRTAIDTKLFPNTNYTLTAHVLDIYGQTQNGVFTFKTGEIPKKQRELSALQPSSTITKPDKTRLTFAVRNVPTILVSVCELAPEDYIVSRANSIDFNSQEKCQKRYEKTIIGAPHYYESRLVQVNIPEITNKKFGLYSVILKDATSDLSVKSWLQITDLSIIEKKSAETSYVFVYDLNTLQPLSGTKTRVGNIIKNENGPAKLQNIEELSTTDSGGKVTHHRVDSEWLVAEHAGVFAVLYNDRDKLNYPYANKDDVRTYIYTDRPMYKPSDTVSWKAIIRKYINGRPQKPEETKEKFTLDVKSFNNDKLIFSDEKPIDSYGVSQGSFVIPVNADLGSYGLNGNFNGKASIQVEEYKGAAFKLHAQMNKSEFIGVYEKAVLNLSGELYSGIPLSGANVSIHITSQNNLYYCEYESEECNYKDKFETTKKVKLDSNGKLSQYIDLISLFKKDSYADNERVVSLNISVTANNGDNISTQTSFTVFRSGDTIDLHNAEYYGVLGQPYQSEVKVETRATRSPRVGEPVEVFVDKVEWVNNERQEYDGNYYKNWTQTFIRQTNFNLLTDSNGKASFTWTPQGGGEYRMQIRTARDARYENYLYVSGDPNDTSNRAPNNNNSLVISSPKGAEMNVGATVPFLISQNSLSGVALIALEQAEILDYKFVPFNSKVFVHNVFLKEEYAPNVVLSVTVFSSDGVVAYEESDIAVNTQSHTMKIKADYDKKQYLPGENAKLTISVMDHLGKPIPDADLSVSVVNESVLALYGNYEKDPLSFFISSIAHEVATFANWLTKLEEMNIPLGNGAKGGDGGNDLSRKKRGIFKDTAFWVAQLTTDKNGMASTEFIFPDNITSWQTEIVAHTKDNQFGQNRLVISTNKKLSSEILAPSFLSYGDHFMLPVLVQNTSDAKLDITLSGSSNVLWDKSEPKKELTLLPKTSETVYLEAAAPTDELIKLIPVTVTARSGSLADIVELEIPMHTSVIKEFVADSSFSLDGMIKTRIKKIGKTEHEGDIKITGGATVGNYIATSMLSMASYPYGCTEQIASKARVLALLASLSKKYAISMDEEPITTVYDGTRNVSIKEVIEKTISELQKNQMKDGAFSYYSGMQGNKELTTAVFEALLVIKSTKDYDVPESLLAKAQEYLESNMFMSLPESEINYVGILHDLSVITSNGRELKKGSVKDVIAQLEYVLDKEGIIPSLGGRSLVEILMLKEKGYFNNELVKKADKELLAKIRIDAHNAYILSGNRYYYYDTNTSATALYLKYLVDKGDLRNLLVPKLVSYLTSNQKADGMFGSTEDTVIVADALIYFMEKTSSSFFNSTLTIALDGKKINEKKITKKEIFKPLISIINEEVLSDNRIHILETTRVNTIGRSQPVFSNLQYGYYIPAEDAPEIDRGFSVKRTYAGTKIGKDGTETARVGDLIKVTLTIKTDWERNLVGVDDAIAAGFDILNEKFKTTEVVDEKPKKYDYSSEKIDAIRELYPSYVESRTDRRFIFVEKLMEGTYEYTYHIRARVPGVYALYPTTAFELYQPDIFGRTGGKTITITQ